MKERQRWRAEEDSLLRAYVKQYGPREWHLVSQRMDKPLHRDAKSCLERWKNYLKPGIKKGSLTEEEQRLVIQLQAKHGNKWKKIAAEIPGRTAKRLGKWWEVFKEKQQREQKENNKSVHPIEEGKYDQILETFAEKIVKERSAPAFLMATSNNGFLHHTETTPSLALSLSSPTVAPPPPWIQSENASFPLSALPPQGFVGEAMIMSELIECCRELDEGHRAWAAHRKEASWRLKRLELQLESEKMNRRKEKTEEVEAKIEALREEQKATLERIEEEYREQLVGLRSDVEAKQQKLANQWATQHSQLSRLVDQLGRNHNTL